jgi:hypothetical protein
MKLKKYRYVYVIRKVDPNYLLVWQNFPVNPDPEQLQNMLLC